ncbi:MAG: transporter suffix domain-containing protein [Deltaproteobacteria bacterium]|nr:transporter suffix domain-containing protein [Deltaproteobacteria bacterium]
MNEKGKIERSAPTWRFKSGIFLLAFGALCPLFTPLVAMTSLSTEWKTALTGLLLVGFPEIFSLLAIAVMGKEGFNIIKAKVFAFFKRHALPKEVSRTRYRTGLVIFLIPLLFGWLAPYGPELIPGYESHRLAINIGGDVLLILSLFVLGGEFWEKVKALFTYEARTGLST